MERLLVVTQPFNDLSESNVLPHVRNLDLNSLTLFRIGDDHDVATLNPSDPVALLADVLNLDFSYLTFLNRWFRWLALLL